MAITDVAGSVEARTHFRFSHGLRFELFYALQALCDDDARIHQRWRERVSQQMPRQFRDLFARLGGSALIWPLLADAPGPIEPSVTYTEMIGALGALDAESFRYGILIGALHEESAVRQLIDGRIDLAQAINSATDQKKHLWFTCLGVYPYDEDGPMPTALLRLLRDPGGVRDDALRCVELFWEHGFAATWKDLETELQRSMREKRRLFDASSVGEFLAQAVMRLEIDEERHLLRAVRGGCEVPLATMKAAHVMPSAFNYRRIWTTYAHDGGDTCFIPYFDASIAVEPQGVATAGTAAFDLDPALIFKALGDGTRYAMVRLIGHRPRSSAELAKELGVSKATISHHLSLLREAGLVGESYEGGAVRLSLRTDVIGQLSSLASSVFAPAP